MKQPFVYRWWKSLPDRIRRPVVFIFGMLLVTIAPFFGALPGPGGIIIFLGGIGVLASEFDWAENFKEVVMKKAPEEVKKRWRPTPRWQVVFDVTTLMLLTAAIVCYLQEIYLPVVSLTAAAIAITAFNRNRLERLKTRIKRKR